MLLSCCYCCCCCCCSCCSLLSLFTRTLQKQKHLKHTKSFITNTYIFAILLRFCYMLCAFYVFLQHVQILNVLVLHLSCIYIYFAGRKIWSIAYSRNEYIFFVSLKIPQHFFFVSFGCSKNRMSSVVVCTSVCFMG